MKQIGLACHNYHDANQKFPCGGMTCMTTTNPAFPQYYSNWGPFQGLLPYYEQGTLANSFNNSLTYFDRAQDTVNATKQNALACPSDPEVLAGNGIYTQQAANGTFNYNMCLTSYRGINGPWYAPIRNMSGATAAQYQQMATQGLGVIYHGSSVGIDGITDGTSNTFLLGEYVYSRLNQQDKNCWHWWCAGNTDTIGTAMYAPNVAFSGSTMGSPGDPILASNSATLAVISQSSNHPGGANHLFADGSVKFIKNTVQSWVPDFNNSISPGFPGGVNITNSFSFGGRTLGTYTYIGNLPIYQALSTRAGGEVISADQF